MKLAPINNPHSKIGQVQKKTKSEVKDEFIDKTKTQVIEKYGKKSLTNRFNAHKQNMTGSGTNFEAKDDNFKLEVFYDFNVVSHALIKSKFKNKYFHLLAMRSWDDKKNKPINIIEHHYIEKVYKKKIDKIKFFKDIIEKDKKENRFMIAGFETYKSPKGVDYYELYKNGKL